MKTTVAAASLGAVMMLFAPPAVAMEASAPEAQDLMKEYFGNTRICRIEGWMECHMWLEANGTYVLFGFQSDKYVGGTRPGFHVYRGKWSIEGSKGAYRLCRKQEDEERTGCLPEPERPDVVGDKTHLGDIFWKYHDGGPNKGTTERYYIVKGHV